MIKKYFDWEPNIPLVQTCPHGILGSDRVQQRSVCLTEGTSVRHAAQYLREKQVRSVGGSNSSGHLAVVASQSDISDKLAVQNKCPAWMKISDILTRDLISVTTEKTLEDCLRLMEQNSIFQLIVVDDRLGFRGMLSITERGLLKEVVAPIRRTSPGHAASPRWKLRENPCQGCSTFFQRSSSRRKYKSFQY